MGFRCAWGQEMSAGKIKIKVVPSAWVITNLFKIRSGFNRYSCWSSQWIAVRLWDVVICKCISPFWLILLRVFSPLIWNRGKKDNRGGYSKGGIWSSIAVIIIEGPKKIIITLALLVINQLFRLKYLPVKQVLLVNSHITGDMYLSCARVINTVLI